MVDPHKEEAAFVRLHALVRKGYRADLGVKDDTNLIRLEHPRGPSAGAPALLLCSDGRIIGSDNVQPLNNGEGDPDCIYVESESDRRLFQSFVNSIPAPTISQQFDSMTIWEMRTVIIVLLICAVFAVGLWLIGMWGWQFVKALF